ncbi:MAG: hypothetical protein KA085_12275 [Phenylobacterium sp.]|uniref:hypothetical protein n=1 Tax=Phenylobacterium sp. TaxID=1871053 RepID=UPI001B64B376|nr:hypothetical protein [Phenylobacterium sp.]MBP7649363.1 hypothetical protein [Phenylobacterium sp.]MBP7816897.1 hypothetical protein [Phenylobacterium sp.]MBP8246172.1 hypothetical protein [Phenylobacterium sp.]
MKRVDHPAQVGSTSHSFYLFIQHLLLITKWAVLACDGLIVPPVIRVGLDRPANPIQHCVKIEGIFFDEVVSDSAITAKDDPKDAFPGLSSRPYVDHPHYPPASPSDIDEQHSISRAPFQIPEAAGRKRLLIIEPVELFYAFLSLGPYLYGSDLYKNGELGVYRQFGGSLSIPAPQAMLDVAPFPF